MSPSELGPRVRHLLRTDLLRTVLANTSARFLAVVGVALATVLVARTGGPDAVGAYALLRILPGLAGVLAVGGLPNALAYFLARSRRSTPGLWPTLMCILAGGSALGTLAWLALSPLLASTFFPEDTTGLVALAGVAVSTQLLLTVSKTALQGLEDRRGSDLVIAAEELVFLPCYAAALVLGVEGTTSLLAGLVLADVLVAAEGWRRVSGHLGWRRLGLHRAPRGWWGVPDRRLTLDVLSFGVRGQVGGLLTLLNLRLDFAILGAMAGPAVLGTYAVASKLAEVLRLPGTALTWVVYPWVAGVSDELAAQRARRLVRPTLVAIAAVALPLLLVTSPILRGLYGSEFDPATTPARILVLGMLLSGAAGVASGFLYGRGRPGLNSLTMGLGLLVTLVLDLALIPRFGATGAAVASTTAYLLIDLTLVLVLLRLTRAARASRRPALRRRLEVRP